MRKWIYILIFGIGIMHLISAVSINDGTVLNTSISNSSVTFSFDINASNFTIESNSVLLYGMNFTNSTGTYLCDDINHSTTNSNLDSSEFNCVLQIGPLNDTSPDDSSLGGGGGFWMGIRESETSEELKIEIGTHKHYDLHEEITSNLTGIKRIRIKSNDRIYGNIAIKPLEQVPEECNIEHNGTYHIYELLEIKEDFNVSKLENITFHWAVDNLWIQENDISHIQVVKCYPKYEVLRTEKVHQTEDHVYHDVHSDSFSIWAVLGIKNPEKFHIFDDEQKLRKWIYFAVGILSIIIFFVVFLLSRKKKGGRKRNFYSEKYIKFSLFKKSEK